MAKKKKPVDEELFPAIQDYGADTKVKRVDGSGQLLEYQQHDLSGDVLRPADAAALVQYVYADNPLYTYMNRKKFHTETRCWHPYIIDDKQTPKWTKLRNGISGLLGNGAFLGFSSASDDFTNALHKTPHTGQAVRYLSNEYFGLLGGRIESARMNPEEMFSNLRGRLTRTRTGFRSMIFYKMRGESIDSIVYVTEGSKPGLDFFGGGIRGMTDWVGDWVLSNAGQGLSGLSPQHTLSIQNAKILHNICSAKNIKLFFAGHSLGGGLAVVNSLATKRPAVVFDNAGVNYLRRLNIAGVNLIRDFTLANANADAVEKSVMRRPKKLNYESIDSYHMDGEFLSTKVYEVLLPNHVEGTRLHYTGNEKYGAFALHDMLFVCNYFKLEELKDNDIANGI